MDSLIVIKVV